MVLLMGAPFLSFSWYCSRPSIFKSIVNFAARESKKEKNERNQQIEHDTRGSEMTRRNIMIPNLMHANAISNFGETGTGIGVNWERKIGNLMKKDKPSK